MMANRRIHDVLRWRFGKACRSATSAMGELAEVINSSSDDQKSMLRHGGSRFGYTGDQLKQGAKEIKRANDCIESPRRSPTNEAKAEFEALTQELIRDLEFTTTTHMQHGGDYEGETLTKMYHAGNPSFLMMFREDGSLLSLKHDAFLVYHA